MPKQKPNWDKIRIEYETTGISYRKLATKHGVSFSTLEKRARRENWQATKTDIETEIATKVRQKVTERKSERIVNEIDPALEATALINQLVLETLQDTLQFKRHLVQMKEKSTSKIGKEFSTDERQWVEEQVFDVVDTKRLQAAAQALKISKELQNLIKGFIDAATQEKLDIERKKYELAKQIAEKDNTGANDVYEIVDPFADQEPENEST